MPRTQFLARGLTRGSPATRFGRASVLVPCLERCCPTAGSGHGCRLHLARVRLHFTPASIGFVYLIVVVFAAAYGGFRQATVTSIAAVTCLDYFFFPPIFSFTISRPEELAGVRRL